MSNYTRRTINPKTGEYEDAIWLDNHFGHHEYGIQFINDGSVYEQDEVDATEEPTVSAERHSRVMRLYVEQILKIKELEKEIERLKKNKSKD